MKSFLVFLVIIFVFSPVAIAYPQDQFRDCISTAQENPNIKGVPQSSIENYCDCALKSIVDQGKEIKEAGYQCASKYFS